MITRTLRQAHKLGIVKPIIKPHGLTVGFTYACQRKPYTYKPNEVYDGWVTLAEYLEDHADSRGLAWR